jgi:hypothetical protein
MFHGQLAVCAFDIIGAGIAIQTENLVVVTLFGHSHNHFGDSAVRKTPGRGDWAMISTPRPDDVAPVSGAT